MRKISFAVVFAGIVSVFTKVGILGQNFVRTILRVRGVGLAFFSELSVVLEIPPTFQQDDRTILTSFTEDLKTTAIFREEVLFLG